MTNYWDLAEKDVINIKNGEVMGRFDDVEIDTRKGRITAFYIEEASKFIGMLGKTKPKRIRWEEILKIGMDVIIVNVDDDKNNKQIKDMLEYREA
ncbi:MAG TPA: YlmC/YmxH family sporulation protein [Sedimentibacter sp.]|nr:YlmC/YmxH family sporulation protein [Sedimentibacter sp.]HOH69819.1 YlmC/YmxH family sporulation protein [Sedimentibacter sp.]HQB63208.1 YlmC/YmxH family sporulation protein [Sedimentibacter sp.]